MVSTRKCRPWRLSAAAVILAIMIGATPAAAQVVGITAAPGGGTAAVPGGGTAAAPAGNAAVDPLDTESSVDYSTAQSVNVLLGSTNAERGIRLLLGPADGRHEVAVYNGSEVRRTVPGAGGGEQFFYFDIDNRFMYGGTHSVEVAVAYLDSGFAPIVLDYDAAGANGSNVGRRERVTLATRGNTESWKTIRKVLPNARFAGGLSGADFRIGSTDILAVRTVAVYRPIDVRPAGTIRVFLDGRELEFTDAWPFLTPQNSVVVPLRAISEALGSVVNYDPGTRAIDVFRGDVTIRMVIDSVQAYRNGQPMTLPTPPRVVRDRTYVPLRFFSESFGLLVGWDGPTQTVTLETGPSAAEKPFEPFTPPAASDPSAADAPAGLGLCGLDVPFWLRPPDCQ